MILFAVAALARTVSKIACKDRKRSTLNSLSANPILTRARANAAQLAPTLSGMRLV
jgi:hypothetical protein